ncbi:hypothetical protein DJ82_05515 [Halorubrum sp. Ib24]|uniref:hypothetical protein n=1 Tax=unclassified Halorubrum TaxID=2642239 RepID=UPI000B98A730|nr:MULTISPECIES: hypothetical protein [unclassified Halorubrum]OYR39446.1 hypothetical protein DJ75_16390 [Halorubrum sp. Eb13]OYR41233.1 hypothetical protein DJ82_05515 [Halorubrum sp. Ib24]OYR50129.1 hypothetical protein DJ74_07205 [Halorubrum sp. Ea8]OYR52947.1 hypothetical protein DJ73_09325 [Halorubrum sp. Ea1]
MTETKPIDDSDEESLADRVRSHVTEHRTGMVQDLLFAVVWVTLVSLLFDYAFTNAPQWVFYMFMLAGIPAYFGFFISLEMAKEQR